MASLIDTELSVVPAGSGGPFYSLSPNFETRRNHRFRRISGIKKGPLAAERDEGAFRWNISQYRVAPRSYFREAVMRKMLILAALLGSISPAHADTADANLSKAVLVEWMVAHCDQSKIPTATVGVSAMVINGSDAEKVSAKREVVKSGVAGNYSGVEDACSKLLASMK